MRTADDLKQTMRERGLRVTPQRMCIVTHLYENASHPTVEALYDATRVEMPTISLKTVYQTVHDLEALGQVSLLDLGTGSVRVDPNVEDEHQHLVCVDCGVVRDVSVDHPDVRPDPADGEGFRITGTEIVFRGQCATCADPDN